MVSHVLVAQSIPALFLGSFSLNAPLRWRLFNSIIRNWDLLSASRVYSGLLNAFIADSHTPLYDTS